MIIYQEGTAKKKEITEHLNACNQLFNPALSSYVNISQYSIRLKEFAHTFEAWDNSILIGLVGCYLNDNINYNGHISNVSVIKEYHGKGIAKKLLATTIKKASQLGMKSITLEVESTNNAAIKLYKNIGFEISGKNKNKYSMILILHSK